jgi:molybdopterin converting factor small subunit
MNENSERHLIKIRIEVPASLAAIFGNETSRWHIMHREVALGSVLGDLLTIYALNYPEFRRSIFDPLRRQVNQGVDITINSVLLEPSRATETELCDGDRITIVPTYESPQYPKESN